MTNPTPSEFDAKLDDALDNFDVELSKGAQADAAQAYREAKQAIRAAVREMVPKPYSETGVGEGAYFDDRKQGWNAAIAEMLAGIGGKADE
jgi:hypothetical protein